MNPLSSLLWMVMAWTQAQTSQFPPAGWHIATRSECDSEYDRELKEMNDAGIYGDPSISLGMGGGSWDEWWSENPCGYADNSNPPHFRIRYQHNGKDITKCEYFIGGGWEGDSVEECKKQAADKIAPPPFDVPPVETPTGYKFLGNYDAGVKYSESDPKLFIMNLNGHNEQDGVEYRRSCLDKSRFLLMSEDGRWHCLALGKQP